MLSLDYNNLIVISVPGFIIGLMTGRFLASARWQAIQSRLGRWGEWLSSLAFLALLGVTLVVLAVMVVYLKNFPDTSKPAYFWYTLLFGFWMILNLIFESIDLPRKRR